MKEQPECEVDEDGTKYWLLNGQLHREDGPALEWPGGRKWWYLHGEMVHPEALVDLQLSRGTFCYYNEQTGTLHFDENNERTARM